MNCSPRADRTNTDPDVHVPAGEKLATLLAPNLTGSADPASPSGPLSDASTSIATPGNSAATSYGPSTQVSWPLAISDRRMPLPLPSMQTRKVQRVPTWSNTSAVDADCKTACCFAARNRPAKNAAASRARPASVAVTTEGVAIATTPAAMQTTTRISMRELPRSGRSAEAGGQPRGRLNRCTTPSGRNLNHLSIGRARRDRHERLESQKLLFADAFHLHQVFDFLEAAVLLAVFDDSLRHRRSDPWQLFQVGGRGRVDIHRRGGRDRRLILLGGGALLVGGGKRHAADCREQHRGEYNDSAYHVISPRKCGSVLANAFVWAGRLKDAGRRGRAPRRRFSRPGPDVV